MSLRTRGHTASHNSQVKVEARSKNKTMWREEESDISLILQILYQNTSTKSASNLMETRRQSLLSIKCNASKSMLICHDNKTTDS